MAPPSNRPTLDTALALTQPSHQHRSPAARHRDGAAESDVGLPANLWRTRRSRRRLAASTVWRILKNQGIDPAPQRSKVTWTQFLHAQAAVACDFACIDTALLRRYYLLFFIDITSREVFFAGITANPTGLWTTQQARNLFVAHADQLADTAALVRDRGSQFTSAFDEIFRNEGMKILKTPIRTPVANSFAER